MLDQRFSDNDASRRDIPSFIEPRPPLIQNPFMRPRPQKGIKLFEEDSEIEEAELVQVYLRLKPCKVPNTLYEVRSDRCLVTSLDTATAGHGRRTQHNVSKMYTFSKIFGPDCSQKEIFEQVVKDNLKKLPEGQSFTLLTYGASGSGKTYTLMGTVGSPGLVPRSLEYVFRLVDAAQQPAYKPTEGGADKLNYAEQDFELQWVKRLRHDVSAPLRDKYRRMSVQLHTNLTASFNDLSNRERHYVWVSFVEIHNEAIYDLLAPPDKRAKLRIREDTSGNAYVKGATQAFVRSGEEAYDVMVAGKHNLTVAATGVHAQSSRSHCIFTITMLTETGDGGVRTSCVRLCDLAGCERARATRNTGARMQESRAINSSLHVLERCLHMLRRKQRCRNDALVPYRESKLTRLLGTGLSGAKGEAVSMVVTLNPSPEYAYETKHVLSLAAVAQDIQINNTMLVSTLESSTQDTTINCSTEVMKLRSDNERLHFELLQTQVRNKELMAAMDKQQQETANTMRELVEEAKDMTRQYYEAQLKALRSDMKEMADEYESKLSQMPKEIALLEEQLTAESLARARAEKEVQHLRTCIEERDEKATSPQDVMLLSDSENESDDDTSDPFNESLEPIFKKETNKSLARNDTISVHTIDNIDEKDDYLEADKSTDTIKGNDSINSTNIDQIDTKVNDICKCVEILEATTNVTCENTDFDSAHCSYDNQDSIKDVTAEQNEIVNNDTVNLTHDETNDLTVKSAKNDSVKSSVCRGTYFVRDNKLNDNDNMSQNSKEKSISSLRGTYFVNAPAPESDEHHKYTDNVVFKEPVIQKPSAKVAKKVPEILVNKIIRSFKSSQSSDTSLRQFEQLEMASKECDEEVYNQSVFSNIKMLKEKRTYFDDEPVKSNNTGIDNVPPVVSKEKRIYFDNIDVNVELSHKNINNLKNIDEERSPSIVKDNVVSDDFEPSKIKRLLGESFTKPEIVTSVQKSRLAKKQASVDLFESPSIKPMDNIEVARQSIEKLVLNQQSNKKDGSRDIEPKSPMKEKAIKSPVKEKAIHSPMKEKAINTSPLKKDTIKSHLKNEVDKSLFKNESLQPVIKNDGVLLNVKTDVDHLPKKLDIVLSPMKTHAVQSPTKIDTLLTTKKTDAIELPLNENNTAQLTMQKDTVQPTKIDTAHSIMNKGAIQILDVKESVKLPPKKDTVQLPIKKDNIQTLIKVFDSQSSMEKDTSHLSIKIDKVLSYMKKDTNKVEIKKEVKLEPSSSVDEPNQSTNEAANDTARDNTIEDYENIYKDITAPRATLFELLVSQSINETTDKSDKDDTKYNLRKKHYKTNDNKIDTAKKSQAECESKARKRPLRLKRRKNQDDGDTEDKLKDIVNLQSEFSDVTMDVPAPHKVAKDIPSPEKGSEENLSPIMGIQSCPAKRAERRSRRYRQ